MLNWSLSLVILLCLVQGSFPMLFAYHAQTDSRVALEFSPFIVDIDDVIDVHVQYVGSSVEQNVESWCAHHDLFHLINTPRVVHNFTLASGMSTIIEPRADGTSLAMTLGLVSIFGISQCVSNFAALRLSDVFNTSSSTMGSTWKQFSAWSDSEPGPKTHTEIAHHSQQQLWPIRYIKRVAQQTNLITLLDMCVSSQHSLNTVTRLSHKSRNHGVVGVNLVVKRDSSRQNLQLFCEEAPYCSNVFERFWLHLLNVPSRHKSSDVVHCWFFCEFPHRGFSPRRMSYWMCMHPETISKLRIASRIA